MTSSISAIMRVSRAGESLHSKTENCTRWPYFSQTSAMRLSRDAPTPSVLAMSYVTRMSIPIKTVRMGDTLEGHRAGGERAVLPGPMVAPNG